MGIEPKITEVNKQKSSTKINYGTLSYLLINLVSLTTTQVETIFGELEYIEPRLKALGVTLADEEADRA
ncbi:MAG TPA: hypothetical protein VFT87_02920 [Candidatus Saccharimonadales bacterium]|nr:hypothetical protein [Candidatus Saccharimonadales bacterium]